MRGAATKTRSACCASTTRGVSSCRPTPGTRRRHENDRALRRADPDRLPGPDRAAAPFLSWEQLEKLPEEAKGGIDISSAAGAIGAAYLLGVIFDRFADTLLERFNRWNRLLFAIELKEENKALSPDDPFPEDRLQIEVIHEGDEAWEWMDYLRSRIRVARAMTAFVPALTLSMELAMGLRDRPGMIRAVLASRRRRVRGRVPRESDPRTLLPAAAEDVPSAH